MRTLTIALAAGLAVPALAPKPAAAQCDPAPWGSAGGGIMAAGPCGTARALVASGNRLELITTPASGAPALVASLELPRQIKAIQSLGAFAFVHDGRTVYYVDNLTAASNPLRLVSQFTPPDIINGMVNTGATVYTWQCGTLRVIDYTTPASPHIVANTSILGGGCVLNGAIFNNRLYLTGSNVINVMDVTSPASTSWLRSFSTSSSGFVGAITALSGGGSTTRLVYWHTHQTLGSVIQVTDITGDFVPPTFRGTASVPSGPIQVTPNLVIGGGQPGRVHSLNISNPDAPTATLVYSDSESQFRSFASINTRWELAGEGGGFTAVDSNIATLRYRPRPSAAGAIALTPPTGGLTDAFVADGAWGLRCVRIDESFTPPIIGYLGGADAYILDVAVGGGFAFTAGIPSAQCWNLANHASPTLRSTYSAPGTPSKIAAVGTLATLVRFSPILNSETLDLVDFTPVPPLILASSPIPAGESTNRIRMFNGIVARLVAGRLVLYTYTTSSLTQQSSTPLGATLVDAVFAGPLAYVLDADGRVFTLNISSPAAPVLLSTTPALPGESYAAAAGQGDWLAAVGTRISFFNTHNPQAPVLVSAANLPCFGAGVAINVNGRVLVSSGACGVRAYDLPTAFPPFITSQPQPVTACVGGSAMFSVAAQPASAQYQWERFANGSAQPIGGATLSTLTLNNVSPADAQFTYRCVVTTPCGNTTSAAAALNLCYPNCDCSTSPPTLNVNDFQCFLTRYAQGDTYANCDGSTQPPILNINDFQCFLTRYAVGCP